MPLKNLHRGRKRLRIFRDAANRQTLVIYADHGRDGRYGPPCTDPDSHGADGTVESAVLTGSGVLSARPRSSRTSRNRS